MRYVEVAPSPRLASIVERYWILEGTGSGLPEPILPDGRTEIIFHYGTPFTRHKADGTSEVQPVAIFGGQITGPVVLSHRQPAGVASIRLKPAAARAVLGIPASDFTGQLVPLASIAGDASRLCERLAEATSDAERVVRLEGWLLTRQPGQPRADVEAAVATILATGGTVTVEGLTALTGLGRRQLERAFHQEVGLSPKTLARIVRFQRAVRLARRGLPLCEVALACGFYDQAHLALDFRRLALAPPSAWLTAESALGVLLSGGTSVHRIVRFMGS
jgi:AraC-like DNA-binding protein